MFFDILCFRTGRRTKRTLRGEFLRPPQADSKEEGHFGYISQEHPQQRKDADSQEDGHFGSSCQEHPQQRKDADRQEDEDADSQENGHFGSCCQEHLQQREDADSQEDEDADSQEDGYFGCSCQEHLQQREEQERPILLGSHARMDEERQHFQLDHEDDIVALKEMLAEILHHLERRERINLEETANYETEYFGERPVTEAYLNRYEEEYFGLSAVWEN